MIYIIVFVFTACQWNAPANNAATDSIAIAKDSLIHCDSLFAYADGTNAQVTFGSDTTVKGKRIDTKGVDPQSLIMFAKTLIGTPYSYGSIDPKVGFDCSGFITYVFSCFNIAVPRSSIDFTQVGTTVPVDSARLGDLILFTGTNPAEKNVGHMGLVVSNDTTGLQFIHSTSGKKWGVTISPLDEYYKKRFVRVGRVFYPSSAKRS